jgi:hypothetical protein
MESVNARLSKVAERIKVEAIRQAVIQTASRAKIPQFVSYPIGAEAISNALAGTAQFDELKLHFYHWQNVHLAWRCFEVLRVEYWNGVSPVQESPIGLLYPRPLQYTWELVVQPVPRVYRHRTKLYLETTALPMIKEWLEQRNLQSQKGSDILAFFLNEKTDEYEAKAASHLEPKREIK